ncbi:MAG TPA: SH3 domain-containing protein, partial [Inquilinus sp.]
MTSCLRGLLLGSVFALAAAGPAFAQTPAAVPAPPAPPAVLEEMDALSFVTWASASVRGAPNGTAELKETLPFGSQVIVTGRLAAGGWVRVQTPKTPVGYMWAQTLAPMRIAMPGAAAEGTPGVAPADDAADDT